MKAFRKIGRSIVVLSIAFIFMGCAEAKIGLGPFKALSVEVGPGGVEAKGPSAGPVKTTGKEVELGREDKK